MRAALEPPPVAANSRQRRRSLPGNGVPVAAAATPLVDLMDEPAPAVKSQTEDKASTSVAPSMSSFFVQLDAAAVTTAPPAVSSKPKGNELTISVAGRQLPVAEPNSAAVEAALVPEVAQGRCSSCW